MPQRNCRDLICRWGGDCFWPRRNLVRVDRRERFRSFWTKGVLDPAGSCRTFPVNIFPFTKLIRDELSVKFAIGWTPVREVPIPYLAASILLTSTKNFASIYQRHQLAFL